MTSSSAVYLKRASMVAAGVVAASVLLCTSFGRTPATDGSIVSHATDGANGSASGPIELAMRQNDSSPACDTARAARTHWRPAQNCGCIPLCNETDIAFFVSHLPHRLDCESPWHGYLRRVYGNATPATANISQFEIFYLDHLPIKRCATNKTTAWCPSAMCKGWMVHKAARFDAFSGVRQLQARGYQIKVGGSVLHVPEPRASRTPALSHTWLEVWRTYYPNEGLGYGCWAWRARGSGVFINVGRTLAFTDRDARKSPNSAYGILGGTQCSNTSFMGRAIRSQTQKFRTFCTGDFSWAIKAQSLGKDSLQILHSNLHAYEVIVSSSACTDALSPLATSCFPSGIEVRRGWNASGGTCQCQSNLKQCLKQ